MHGIIHLELKKFVERTFGGQAWSALVEQAGLGAEIYTPLRSYPDQQLFALLQTAVELTGIDRDTLIEQFGEFLVPTYLDVYSRLLDPSWRTLDVIEHTEETIHRVIRARQPDVAPPRLKVARPSSHEVVVTYDSDRKLCGIARGIARGLARHFQEEVSIRDLRCMLRGDPVCLISVRQAPGGDANWSRGDGAAEP